MEKTKTISKIIIIALIILPVLFIGLYIFDVLHIRNFNSEPHTFVGEDSEYDISMSSGGRADSTSTWVKVNYDLGDRVVDLSAQTFDSTFTNNTAYEINKWSMKINFNDECYFNNAWCGTVEIHQNVLNNEKAQILDLRNYNLDYIDLDYMYDGDLLIKMYPGDYVIYKPSQRDGELPVSKYGQITIGFILYYEEFPDLSETEITYQFNRQIKDDNLIYVIYSLVVIWSLLLITFIVSTIVYRTAAKEMAIKKAGIVSVSDMYSIIYIIDLIKDELTPVVADDASEMLRPKNIPASAQLKNIFECSCTDAYKDIAYEFCDFSTLAERLKNRNTIVFEYKSKQYGWSRVRFFAMDREKDRDVEKVVFTIQSINQEKEEIENISKRVDFAEYKSQVKSAFLNNAAVALSNGINDIIAYDSDIIKNANDADTKSSSGKIYNTANLMIALISSFLNYSKLDSGSLQISKEEYSLHKMVLDACELVKGKQQIDNLDVSCEVSPSIPDRLYGDSEKIKIVLFNLLLNAVENTDRGTIKLTVFGKSRDNQVHLLFSVKDSGKGIDEEQQRLFARYFSHSDNTDDLSDIGIGMGLSLVSGVLSKMNSKLQLISKLGEGSEFYFELEQGIKE